MTEAEFDAILPKLEAVIAGEKHSIVSVFDTVSNEYLGGCEVLHQSGDVIRIIQDKISSSYTTIYINNYDFNKAAKQYTRTQTKMAVATADSVIELRERVEKLEAMQATNS